MISDGLQVGIILHRLHVGKAEAHRLLADGPVEQAGGGVHAADVVLEERVFWIDGERATRPG